MVLCKPGVIQEIDGTEMPLLGEPEYYHYYEPELQPGAYVYISVDNDSVWFYVEDSVYYTLPEDTSANREFEVIY